MNGSNECVEMFDTTLRDGAQGEGISFSVQDKLAVVLALDELGISWIEAGNPGSNPKEREFFSLAGSLPLARSRLCAFGSTRRPGLAPEEDPQLHSLLAAETPGVAVFGKCWDLHVTEVLRVSLQENLDMIAETVAFFKRRGKTVFFDGEHFFDGAACNRDYALAALRAAAEGGADRLVLCDTNGGAFPADITREIRFLAAHTEYLPRLGIHAHNDSGLAAANSIAAVQEGCRHVQGTLLGIGERCGNACLAALIPALELKLALRCLPEGALSQLTIISRAVAEIANIALPDNMPYIGSSAFAHKAGMHADGILKTRRSFEHIDPLLVGNDRRFLMSEVGGRSAIAERARKIEPSLTRDDEVIRRLFQKLKALEAGGWQFEGADGSFELLVRRELGRHKRFFSIAAYRVMSEHPAGNSTGGEALACSYGWVKVLVDGRHEIAASEGEGPVNALDGALRRALRSFYPELEQVRLTDYKVRVIDGNAATAAKVRVLIRSTDGKNTWTTVGVSADIIEASCIALEDSISYKLTSDRERGG